MTADEIVALFGRPGGSGLAIGSALQIFYFATPQQLKQHAKNLESVALESSTPRHHLILLENKLQPVTAKTILEAYHNTHLTLEMFDVSELQFNISHHDLVPRHEVLTKEEADAIVAQFGVARTQLPHIVRSEPMARYLGLRPGQVIRITSISPTAGEYISYRVCV